MVCQSTRGQVSEMANFCVLEGEWSGKREVFGLLKAVLETISAVYTHEVRLRDSTENFPSTDPSTGDYRR